MIKNKDYKAYGGVRYRSNRFHGHASVRSNHLKLMNFAPYRDAITQAAEHAVVYSGQPYAIYRRGDSFFVHPSVEANPRGMTLMCIVRRHNPNSAKAQFGDGSYKYIWFNNQQLAALRARYANA